MQAPFHVSPYILAPVNKAEITLAELIRQNSKNLKLVRNLAIHVPRNWSPNTSNWNEKNIAEGRQAILEAFEILGKNGSDEAVAAIQLICEKIQAPPFDGSDINPDYRDLIKSGIESLEAVRSEKALLAARQIQSSILVESIKPNAGYDIVSRPTALSLQQHWKAVCAGEPVATVGPYEFFGWHQNPETEISDLRAFYKDRIFGQGHMLTFKEASQLYQKIGVPEDLADTAGELGRIIVESYNPI